MNLGICLEKGAFHYALVDGSKSKPNIFQRGKRVNPEPNSYPQSANWYKSSIGQILHDNSVDHTIIKLHFKLANMNAMLTHGLPIGVIALCCAEHKIPLSTVTKAKLKGHTAFGLPKGTKAFDWVNQFKDGEPYWTDSCRTAILAGFSEL